MYQKYNVVVERRNRLCNIFQRKSRFVYEHSKPPYLTDLIYRINRSKSKKNHLDCHINTKLLLLYLILFICSKYFNNIFYYFLIIFIVNKL